MTLMLDNPLATDDGEQPGIVFPLEHAGRPFYLTGPCPPWCAYGHDSSEWAYDDRLHRSSDYDVTLTAMDAVVDAVDEEVSIEPRRMSACLWQHYREAEPRVVIAHGDEPEAVAELTLDEAEQHARDLLELVALARAAQ
jgi:hypothetical protein